MLETDWLTKFLKCAIQGNARLK